MRYLLLAVLAVSSVWGQGIAPPDFLVYTEIRKYLALTDEQVAKMMKQSADYSLWAAQRQRRIFEVQLEIGVETAKSPLDPAALGVRYAEVETIRREMAERDAALVPANVALLTEAQKTKLKALEEALKLASTGSEAKGLRLLPEDCLAGTVLRSGIFGGGFSGIPVGGVLPGFVTTGCGVGILPVGFGLRFNFEEIQKYLGLTDEQVAKMLKQNAEYSMWASLRQQRMFEVQLEIGLETAKSPLDPAALGVRYAEVETIRREIAERGAALVPANVALLTEAQKVKLKALEEALKLASTGSEAKGLRLLPDDCLLTGQIRGGDFSTILAGGVVPQLIAPGCGAGSSVGGFLFP